MKDEIILKQIDDLKSQISAIGKMRVGSISKQFNVCGTPGCRCKDKSNPQKHGPYFYLRASYGKKNTTQFVRKEFVPTVEREIAEYRKFKKLVDLWIRLSIKLSDAELQGLRNQKSKN
jgi:hypothetical protein